jgi:cellulose synthase/poly-beta-1,6-N-acetylglucosamine synthase-like glycosyltransferase
VGKYFPRLRASKRAGIQTIGICVPCYNENQYGLNNTLNSLYALEVPPGFSLSVLILMDGVKDGQGVPAPCTRKYLSNLFGVDWAPDAMAELKQTTIIESLKWFNPSSVPADTDTIQRGSMLSNSPESPIRQDFRVSVLIKKRNLRKHNSHQWFMAAFARELSCKYILCTDCSTVFEKSMLAKLTTHLENNPGTTAVCGRQRVMSVQLQNEGSGKPLEGEFWGAPAEYALRQIQTYDFEADHPVSKAVYGEPPGGLPVDWVLPVGCRSYRGGPDFLGFLPVLPGPCGLYRYDDLRRGRYRKYFELVPSPPNISLS